MVARRRVSTPALEFEVLEAGSGPLALCMHGFPDTAHSFRHLLRALADAGFHAVAPFMRGYAPTEVPSDGSYSRAALASDAVALHEALGGDSDAVVIGHDWGAAAAYGAAASESGRFRRVVTLGIPPPGLEGALFTDYEQIKRFFYMFVFQSPAAEELIAAQEMEFLARLWADWSPGYDAADDLAWVADALPQRENISAALGYYRALFADIAAGAGMIEPPQQPTLYLHGARDGCIGAELVRSAHTLLSADSRAEVLEGVGHFLHLERPEEVGRLILQWVS